MFYKFLKIVLAAKPKNPTREDIYRASGLLFFVISQKHSKRSSDLSLDQVQNFDVYRTQWETKLDSDLKKLNKDKLWKDSVTRVKNLKFHPKKGVPSLRKLRQTIRAGAERKDWYESTFRAIQERFGDDAEAMMKFLVHMSPGNEVSINVTQAVKAFIRWKTGQPFGASGGQRGLGRRDHHWNMERSLKDDPDAGGKKLQNFHQSFLRNDNAVVIDRWMLRNLGIDTRDENVKLSDGDYEVLAEVVRHITKDQQLKSEFGPDLKPRQVMAMLWAGIKRKQQRRKKSDDRPYEEILNDLLGRDASLKEQLMQVLGKEPPERDRHYEEARHKMKRPINPLLEGASAK